MKKKKRNPYAHMSVILLYTVDGSGDWYYIYGQEADCRAWIAPFIGDENCRYEVLGYFRSFPACKDAAERLVTAALADKTLAYKAHAKFANGGLQPAEYISHARVLCKWRCTFNLGPGSHQQALYLTKFKSKYFIRSRDRVYLTWINEHGAIKMFDRYTAQPR